jgi:hypothetical protein
MYVDSIGASYRRASSLRRIVLRNNSAIASSYVATTGILYLYLYLSIYMLVLGGTLVTRLTSFCVV